MSELKLCPKCLSENVELKRIDIEFIGEGYYVVCKDCKEPSNVIHTSAAKDKAIEAWNKRGNEINKEEIERLERLDRNVKLMIKNKQLAVNMLSKDSLEREVLLREIVNLKMAQDGLIEPLSDVLERINNPID